MASDEPYDEGSGGSWDTELTDSFYSQFLNNADTVSGLSFPLASGISVTTVARTIAASILFVVAIGAQTVIQGLTAAVTTIVVAVRSLATTLIATLIEPGIAVVAGAWTFAVDGYGPFAIVVVIAVLLLTIWIADRGFETILEIFSP